MPDPRRGEIWRVDFEPIEGSEIGKERPAVVIGDEIASSIALCVRAPKN